MFGLQLWPLYLIAALAALLGLLCILLPFRGTWRWLKTRKSPEAEKRAKRPKAVLSGVEILAGVALAAVAVAAVSLVMAVASYRAFSEKTLVMVVKADPHPRLAHTMTFSYSLVEDGKELPQPPMASFEGDQWRVEGHLLRWSNWARLLGLRTCYRLTRIDGRYASAAMARTRKSTLIDLGGEEDFLWVQLQKNDNRLPGVSAVHGHGAYRYPEAGARFEVYVTPGGLVIEKR